MSTTINVLCVDDNRFVGEAISQQLGQAEGFHCVGHLLHAENLLEHIKELAPDVVLLDIDMPGPDPLESLSQITSECPDVAVLILSGYMRPDLVDRSIDAGASGYLSKNDDVDALLACIQRAAQGEFVLGELISGEHFRSSS